MALHQQTDSDRRLFTGYGDDYVDINGHRYRQPVVLMSGALRTDWGAVDFAGLTAAHFDYFLALEPEVLLLGTGAKQQFARPELYRNLIAARIAIEFMDTPAACRTFNILAAEDRKVIAAVLL